MAEGRILIVDDEESMCQFLSIMLKREGYEVTAVTTGADALKQMQKEPADVVITDIQMPKMDGLQVLAGIKAVDPTVPVIIMTAYASKQTAIEAVNRAPSTTWTSTPRTTRSRWWSETRSRCGR